MADESASGRWPRRWAAAAALRALGALGPAMIALATSWAVARALPPTTGASTRVGGAALAVCAAVAVAVAATRLLRRTVPLAWLLSVDVAFPGEAPSRTALAMRAGRTIDLERDLADRRLGDDDQAAAERIIRLAAAMTAHDRATRGHSERVRGYTRLIGESMGVARGDLDRLAWAGLLHDVGKLTVDPEVLNKPCHLDDDEAEVMRRHPIEGARLAAPLMPWLGEWGDAIAHHHERWDGTGYPAGLAGTAISLGGRIVAVADAFEAMTARRAYNTPKTLDAARHELVDGSGTQFDADVVRALLAVPLGRLSRVALPSAAVGALPSANGVLHGLGDALPGLSTLARQGVAAVAGTAAVSAAALAPAVAAAGAGGPDGAPTEVVEADGTSSGRGGPASAARAAAAGAAAPLGDAAPTTDPTATPGATGPPPTTAPPTTAPPTTPPPGIAMPTPTSTPTPGPGGQDDPRSPVPAPGTPPAPPPPAPGSGGGIAAPIGPPPPGSAVGAVGGAAGGAVEGLGGAVSGALEPVEDLVTALPSAGPVDVGATAGGVVDTVGGAVEDATGAVDDVVEGVSGAVGGTVDDLVGDAVGAGGAVEDVVEGVVDGVVGGVVEGTAGVVGGLLGGG